MERKQRILLVDKLAIQTFLLQSIIIDEGYNCNIAESKEDALNLLNSYSIDVIILDAIDPNIEGISLLQELRNHLEYAHIPILALSVKTDFSNIEKVLNGGADDYITKPFNIQDLLNKLAEISSCDNKTGRKTNKDTHG